MRVKFTPIHTTLAGTTILMAYACGAGSSSAKLLSMGGVSVTSKVTHWFILSVGALFVLRGLWRIQRCAAFVAALSFAALAAAAALMPPTLMSAAHEPWHGLQIVGGLLYLIFAALLVYGFWIAFPTSTMDRPAAKAIALAGTAASMGCACCMVTGAIAGLAVTVGGSPGLFLSYGFTYFSAIAVAAVGFAVFRGFRPIPWLITGALLTHYGSYAIGIFDDWMGGDVNLRFIPVYMMYLVGAALVMKAWAVAYEPITDAEQLAASTAEPAF